MNVLAKSVMRKCLIKIFNFLFYNINGIVFHRSNLFKPCSRAFLARCFCAERIRGCKKAFYS